MTRRYVFTLFALALVPFALRAQQGQPVTSARILKASAEPQNWLTYSGGYSSHRHSQLTQINLDNAKNLEQKWTFQNESLQTFEPTPLVVDGIMYFTQNINDVVAADAKTGRVFWIFRHQLPPDIKPCCGSVNRGVAILGDTLFYGTLDGRLFALDTRNGKPIWMTHVTPNFAEGYSLTLAPLIVK